MARAIAHSGSVEFRSDYSPVHFSERICIKRKPDCEYLNPADNKCYASRERRKQCKDEVRI